MNTTEDLIDVLFEAAVVKRIHRTGWQILGDHEEKVGEHSFMTAVIAHFLGKKVNADMLKVYQMAIFHDFHEARTGEIDKVAKFYVTRDQNKANNDIFKKVDNALLQILNEFEEKESLEARVVYEANILALLVELKVLIERGHHPAKEWLDDTVGRLKISESQEIAKMLLDGDQHSWWKKLRATLPPESRLE